MLSVSQAWAWPVKPCRRSSGTRPSPPQSSTWRRRPLTVTCRSSGRRRFIVAARSELDPAGAPRAAAAADVGGQAVRDHDVRGLLPAQLLQLANRALHRDLGPRRELLGRVTERGRVDLEGDRQCADGGEELGLADVEDLATEID